jgi:cytochrome c peroxidase
MRQALLFVALVTSSVLGVASGCTGSETPDDPARADGGVTTLPDGSSDGAPQVVVENDYTWVLPPGFPKPKVPDDNPITVAKVELGRHLFYDKRLSENGTQACASCHLQEKAFTDGRVHAVGSTGESHRRNSMTLANVGYASVLTWANPLQTQLERQALLPLFGERPVELGFVGKEDVLVERLSASATYAKLFAAAFPADGGKATVRSIVAALASFERTIVSGSSAYDRAVYGGDPSALSDSARRGKTLFFSERLECFHCHGGFSFMDATSHVGKAFDEVAFHNTGLYNVDGKGAYPTEDRGVIEISGKPDDMGRFKAPTLRNIAVTAPYMHDGSIATLEEVIDHYAAGGRTIVSGPNAGVGADSPLKSELMVGFRITETEKADVVAFLRSLTDEELLKNPKLADPWPNEPNP